MLGDVSFVKGEFLLVFAFIFFCNNGEYQGIFECWNGSVGKEN